jgi:hypothetical protein
MCAVFNVRALPGRFRLRGLEPMIIGGHNNNKESREYISNTDARDANKGVTRPRFDHAYASYPPAFDQQRYRNAQLQRKAVAHCTIR